MDAKAQPFSDHGDGQKRTEKGKDERRERGSEKRVLGRGIRVTNFGCLPFFI